MSTWKNFWRTACFYAYVYDEATTDAHWEYGYAHILFAELHLEASRRRSGCVKWTTMPTRKLSGRGRNELVSALSNRIESTGLSHYADDSCNSGPHTAAIQPLVQAAERIVAECEEWPKDPPTRAAKSKLKKALAPWRTTEPESQ